MIPDEAVEAAARAGYEYQYSSLEGKWEFANPGVQEDFRNEFRTALEAASPHMLAAFWDAVADDIRHDTAIDQRIYVANRVRKSNPYRSQK